MSYVTDGFDEKVTELLQRGAVGLLPTDTIYGLSAQALNKPAVERIYDLKGRPVNKAFIILISDIKMLDLLSIPVEAARPVERYWPGPLTVKFEAPSAPAWLTAGSGTIAARLPDYPELNRLIDQTGPLISTSANPAGGQPAQSVSHAQEYFGDKLDFYVDAGPLTGQPSTIIQLIAGDLKIVRQGAVKIDSEELRSKNDI